MSGLKQSRIRGGQPNSGATDGYKIDDAYATKLYSGDPVVLSSTGTIEKATATGPFMGVFNGVMFDDLEGVPANRPIYSGANTGTNFEALIVDDPDALFEIETSTAIGEDDIGKYAGFVLGAGNDLTGTSGTTLDQTSLNVSSAGLPVRIVRISDKRTDSDTRQLVEVERVRFNNL